MVVVVRFEVVVEAGADRGCELLHAAARSAANPSTRNVPLYRKVVKGDDLVMPQRTTADTGRRANRNVCGVPECPEWVGRRIGSGELVGGSHGDVRPAEQSRVVGQGSARDERRPRLDLKARARD